MTEKEEPEVTELVIQFKSTTLGTFKLKFKGQLLVEHEPPKGEV